MVTEERQSKTYWTITFVCWWWKEKFFLQQQWSGRGQSLFSLRSSLSKASPIYFSAHCSLFALCGLKWRLCQTERRAIHSEWGTLTHDESRGSSPSLFCWGWRSSALLRVVPGRESQRTWPGILQRSWWSAECLLSKCGREFACKHQIS